eukprot:CAMPEP_0185846692 /NCGR_PEP_ID=MMETSP1354-20130828/2243_1 /TAXON_ID=708628 /ORGANISM="Erythrolobus madagascarensis, Strain CCMP3276" /LENGTH=388 /DNA_ID=CAMNT_0028546881 /DNA_START=295 /DNA_END=1461 /DNA_ORIENTATION=-
MENGALSTSSSIGTEWSSFCARYSRAVGGIRSTSSTVTSHRGSVIGRLNFHVHGRDIRGHERENRSFVLKCRLVNHLILSRGPAILLRRIGSGSSSDSHSLASQKHNCLTKAAPPSSKVQPPPSSFKLQSNDVQVLSRVLFCGDSELLPLFEEESNARATHDYQWDEYRREISRHLSVHREAQAAASSCAKTIPLSKNESLATRLVASQIRGPHGSSSSRCGEDRAQIARSREEHAGLLLLSSSSSSKRVREKAHEVGVKRARKEESLRDENTEKEAGVGVKSGGSSSSNVCPYCGFVSSRKGNLKRHIELKHLHTLERKYSCAECSLQFSLKHHLLTHIKIKHERSNHVRCNTCGKSFVTQSNLRKHQRIMHHFDSNDGVTRETVPS